MFKKHTFTIFLIVITSLMSCKQTTTLEKSLKSTIQNNMGKKLILPNYITYQPFNNYLADSVTIFSSKLKIYSRVNASCATCISRIESWNDLALEYSKYKVPVILICDSEDEFEIMKYYCESNEIKGFSYPFFLDKKKRICEF